MFYALLQYKIAKIMKLTSLPKSIKSQPIDLQKAAIAAEVRGSRTLSKILISQ
jgi:hypothetical protein